MAVKRICPSILGANFCNLGRDIKILEENGIESVHIDVMDGNFVPNIAFGPDAIKALRAVSRRLAFDVHMMTAHADLFLEKIAEAGANAITVHAEAGGHLYKTVQAIKNMNVQAGVALNPATPITALEYVAPMLDTVLIMTVEPSFGGQQFIAGMLQKITDLRSWREQKSLKFAIQVDGGITRDNFYTVLQHGAEDIVIGSAMFRDNALAENAQAFQLLLKEAVV